MSTDFEDVLNLTAGAKDRGQVLADALNRVGATVPESNALLGIAAAESAWKTEALGAIGERGAWQIERDTLEVDKQAENALASYRTKREEWGAAQDEPLKDLVTAEPNEMMRVTRAQWQRGNKAKGAVGRWYKDIERRYNVVKGPLIAAGVSRESAHSNAVSILLKDNDGEKLGVEDFIRWSGTEGSNVEALERGQNAFSRFMEKAKWAPLVGLERAGTGGVTTTAWDNLKVAGETALNLPGDALSSAIKWGFRQIREGGKTLLGETFRTFLPPVLLGLGVYAGYNVLKKSFTKAKA